MLASLLQLYSVQDPCPVKEMVSSTFRMSLPTSLYLRYSFTGIPKACIHMEGSFCEILGTVWSMWDVDLVIFDD